VCILYNYYKVGEINNPRIQSGQWSQRPGETRKAGPVRGGLRRAYGRRGKYYGRDVENHKKNMVAYKEL
jgi:hypothetical protein